MSIRFLVLLIAMLVMGITLSVAAEAQMVANQDHSSTDALSSLSSAALCSATSDDDYGPIDSHNIISGSFCDCAQQACLLRPARRGQIFSFDRSVQVLKLFVRDSCTLTRQSFELRLSASESLAGDLSPLHSQCLILRL